MDAARHVVGIILAVGTPPAILFWVFIHPLARLWRRAGALITYLVVGALCSLMAWALFHFRNEVLGADLGTRSSLLAPAAGLYLLSAWISLRAKRHLKIPIFAGLPEVAREGGGGVLLKEGIYGIIRHPRYVAVVIGTAGVALFVNYVGTYRMVLAGIPTLYLVAVLEERELAERFGAEYLEYRSRVPAFVPRFRRRHESPGMRDEGAAGSSDAGGGTA